MKARLLDGSEILVINIMHQRSSVNCAKCFFIIPNRLVLGNKETETSSAKLTGSKGITKYICLLRASNIVPTSANGQTNVMQEEKFAQWGVVVEMLEIIYI